MDILMNRYVIASVLTMALVVYTDKPKTKKCNYKCRNR